jgi:hypothetical protein
VEDKKFHYNPYPQAAGKKFYPPKSFIPLGNSPPQKCRRHRKMSFRSSFAGQTKREQVIPFWPFVCRLPASALARRELTN